MSTSADVVEYLETTIANIEVILDKTLTASQMAKLYGFAEKLQLKFIDRLEGEDIRATRKEFVRRCNAILDVLEDRNKYQRVSSTGENSFFCALDFGHDIHSSVCLESGAHINILPFSPEPNFPVSLCSAMHRLMDDGLLERPSTSLLCFSHDSTVNQSRLITNALTSDSRLMDTDACVYHLHSAAALSLANILLSDSPDIHVGGSYNRAANKSSSIHLFLSEHLSACLVSLFEISFRKCTSTGSTLPVCSMMFHEAVTVKDRQHKVYFQNASTVANRLLTNAAKATVSYGLVRISGIWYVGHQRRQLFDYIGCSVDEYVRLCFPDSDSSVLNGSSSVVHESLLPGVISSTVNVSEFTVSQLKLRQSNMVNKLRGGGGSGATEDSDAAMSEELKCETSPNEINSALDPHISSPPPTIHTDSPQASSAMTLPVSVREKACTLIGIRTCTNTPHTGQYTPAVCIIPFVEHNCSLPAKRTRTIHTHVPLSALQGSNSGASDTMCMQLDVVENIVGVYGSTHSITTVDINLPVSMATCRSSSCRCNGMVYSSDNTVTSDGENFATVVGVFLEVTIQLSIDRIVTLLATPLILVDTAEGDALEPVEHPTGQYSFTGSSSCGWDTTCNGMALDNDEVSGERTGNITGSHESDGDMQMSDTEDMSGSPGEHTAHASAGANGVVVYAEWVCDDVASAYKERGNECMKRQDYYSAIEFYSYAIAAGACNGILYSNRCAAYTHLSLYQSALADAQECVRQLPNWAKGWVRHGEVLFRLGRPGAALQSYNKARELSPDTASILAAYKDVYDAAMVQQAEEAARQAREEGEGGKKKKRKNDKESNESGCTVS